ncbi:hydroxyacylglutathione hydrolase [Candidatus Enterovibrio altilux]|uniref:Hydroxyacylglutathione hydrolase n=1 Tax=Candidatus Enterovibrio altilux TaxID=1927128 RepID=A0A291B7C8_9GAMM|nr:hydroxyacylglutathione hydrolase [Candidatus Enterovibrio luxaltus]ATF08896.1 Hydroxyacylglutathione hydrolase [Candidatus Enterovibrio luxaltus]
MLSISSIPAFNDNYIWLIKNEDNHCFVIDPGDASLVFKVLKEQSIVLDGILVTHYHDDHVNGIPALKEAFPNIVVFGPPTARFPYVTNVLKDKEIFVLFNTYFTVYQVPGHTIDHIAFYAKGILFSGDTLFSGGCGRCFEGTLVQMLASLMSLASLPDDTKVYCAHEYTQANLKFAQVIESNNAELNQYAENVAYLREKGLSTLPSSIGHEKAINPFLRIHQPSVKAGVKHLTQNASDLDTFTALRRWKDYF